MKECQGCTHCNVCKYKEQYEKLDVELKSDNAEIKCKYYQGYPATYTYEGLHTVPTKTSPGDYGQWTCTNADGIVCR